MRLIPLMLLCCALSTRPAGAQAAPADTAYNPETVFRRLDLPTPNAVRSGQRRAGSWLLAAAGRLRDPGDARHGRRGRSGARSGSPTRNNSPDTLRYVWLQLDQNLFNSESRGFRVFGQDPRFGTKGAEVSVRLLKVGEPAVPAARGQAGGAGGARCPMS